MSKVKNDFYDMMAMRWIRDNGGTYRYPVGSNQQEMEELAESYEPQQPKPEAVEPKHDAVNPSHYKDIVPGYEYFDVMDYMLEGWEAAEAHAYGNALKYLFRLGKKDAGVQELGKAIWYLERLKDYLEAGGYRNYRENKKNAK